MKRRFIIAAGFAMALVTLWTLPAAAQQQDPGQVLRIQTEQQTQAGQPADAGNRTLTRTKTAAQEKNARGSDAPASTEPTALQATLSLKE